MLTESDVAKLKKVAALVDGTDFDGERAKSVMVCLNILKNKGDLTFVQIIELVLKGQTVETAASQSRGKHWAGQDRARPSSGAGGATWNPDADPFDPRVGGVNFEDLFNGFNTNPGSGRASDDWFYEFLRQQHAAENRKNTKAQDQRTQEQKKREYDRQLYYLHDYNELEYIMAEFFGVYQHDMQKVDLNKGILSFILAHSYDIVNEKVGINIGEDIYKQVGIKVQEIIFIREMNMKEGFDLFISERQFKWMIQIYKHVRGMLLLNGKPINPKHRKEKDVLYKAFLKFKVKYLTDRV